MDQNPLLRQLETFRDPPILQLGVGSSKWSDELRAELWVRVASLMLSMEQKPDNLCENLICRRRLNLLEENDES